MYLGKGSGDEWGILVREQLAGSPSGQVSTLSKEERLENQKIWKKKVGYGKRWHVEITFSAFKRLFGEDV